jgi:hypothetical protein
MGKSSGPFCGGRLRGREGTCERQAGAGTDHKGWGQCSWHGGSSPGGSQSAKERRAEDQARRVLYKYDARPVDDPIGALQRLAGRALALESAIGDMVNDLEDAIRYTDEHGGEQLRAEVAVLERTMDRAGKLLVDIAKLNIEERLARVTEKQAQMAMDALSAAMGEMGMSVAQQREARTLVGRHLRAVS